MNLFWKSSILHNNILYVIRKFIKNINKQCNVNLCCNAKKKLIWKNYWSKTNLLNYFCCCLNQSWSILIDFKICCISFFFQSKVINYLIIQLFLIILFFSVSLSSPAFSGDFKIVIITKWIILINYFTTWK